MPTLTGREGIITQSQNNNITMIASFQPAGILSTVGTREIMSANGLMIDTDGVVWLSGQVIEHVPLGNRTYTGGSPAAWLQYDSTNFEWIGVLSDKTVIWKLTKEGNLLLRGALAEGFSQFDLGVTATEGMSEGPPMRWAKGANGANYNVLMEYDNTKVGLYVENYVVEDAGGL